MKKKNPEGAPEKEIGNEQLHLKLNAIIRLLIELNNKISKNQFTIQAAAQMLHSIGLTPKEIAKILGYESPTDVAPYLYSKKRKKDKR